MRKRGRKERTRGGRRGRGRKEKKLGKSARILWYGNLKRRPHVFGEVIQKGSCPPGSPASSLRTRNVGFIVTALLGSFLFLSFSLFFLSRTLRKKNKGWVVKIKRRRRKKKRPLTRSSTPSFFSCSTTLPRLLLRISGYVCSIRSPWKLASV